MRGGVPRGRLRTFFVENEANVPKIELAAEGIFEMGSNYDNYKTYLLDYIGSLPRRGRGFKTDLAKSLGVHPTFITQVLSRDAHLGMEQGQSINEFLNHDSTESEFFLTLIQYNRAGTASLRSFLKKKVQSIQKKELKLSNRISKSEELKAIDQIRYYSSWSYSAVDILLTIDQYSDERKIAQLLNLPLDEIRKIISYLLDIGLVKKVGSKYEYGKRSVHLPDHSPLIIHHHSNWRLKCLENLKSHRKQDLHYSSCVGVSRQDVGLIKEVMVETINRIRDIVKKSKPEVAHSYCLDFFKI